MIDFWLSRSVCTSAVKSTATDVNAIDGHKPGPLPHVCALLCISSRILVQTSINQNPSLRSKLSLPLRTHIEAMKAFDDMIRRQVLDAGPSDFAKIDLKSMSENGLKTLESNYAMYDVTIGVLDDLLVTRIGNFNQHRTV
jgi:hypothetical protein